MIQSQLQSDAHAEPPPQSLMHCLSQPMPPFELPPLLDPELEDVAPPDEVDDDVAATG